MKSEKGQKWGAAVGVAVIVLAIYGLRMGYRYFVEQKAASEVTELIVNVDQSQNQSVEKDSLQGEDNHSIKKKEKDASKKEKPARRPVERSFLDEDVATTNQ